MAIRGCAKLASVELNALGADGLRQIVEAMPATGPRSEANALRSALWHFSRHLGLDLPLGAFALVNKKPRVRRPKDISDRAAFKGRHLSGVGRSGPRHPWREL